MGFFFTFFYNFLQFFLQFQLLRFGKLIIIIIP